MNRRVVIVTGSVFAGIGLLWEIVIAAFDWFGRLEAAKEISHNLGFLLSKKTPVLPIAIGCCILLSILKRRDAGAEQRILQTAESRAESSSTVLAPSTSSATAAQVQQQHVHVYPVSPQPEKPRTVSTPISAPTHNIRFLRTEVAQLDAEDNETVREVQTGGKQGLVARFRNRPNAGEQVAYFHHARAHIIYQDENEQEIAATDSGCWVGHRTEQVDFELGHTESLVLIVRDGDEEPFAPWMERRRFTSSMGGGEIVQCVLKDLPRSVRFAEVYVIGTNGNSLPQITIDLIEGKVVQRKLDGESLSSDLAL